MKNVKFQISLMAFAILCLSICAMPCLYAAPEGDEVQIWCSSDLSELAQDLVSTYERNNPDAQVSLIEVNNDEYENMLHKSNAIGLMKSTDFKAYSSDNVYRMVVGRDIYVAIMNPGHPYAEEIRKNGLSARELKEIYTGKSENLSDPSMVWQCWCIDDDSNCCLASFLQTDPEAIKSNKAGTREEFLERICGDKYALGFCKLTHVLDKETQLLDDRLALVPIDLNDNDNIDHFENIYGSTADLERGVWIGKYPKVLYSNIFALAGTKPGAEGKAFMRWLSTEGQVNLNSLGYSGLILSERRSNIEDLYADEVTVAGIADRTAGVPNIIIIGGLVLVVALLTFLVIRLFSYRKEKKETPVSGIDSMFGETTVHIPEGLFFDRSHTWTFMEKNGKVRTGIDDFLQHVTGTITRVIMKNPGEQVVKGETYLTLIQDGKQLEIKSPVNGTVIEKNNGLLSNSSLLNSDPYTEGWVYMIETPNWLKETRAYLMGDTYRLWLKDEFIRLKDFLAFTFKSDARENVQVVLQDGGELKEGLLEHFGPEQWEDFQTGFLNISK